MASVDLDIEGGGRIDEKYDTGLPWPFGSSSRPLSWSAKGPADQIPRLSFLQSAKAHLTWAKAGWWDGNRWPEAIRLIAESPEVRFGILKGLLLSGTLAAVVFFFELAFFPTALFQHPSKVAKQAAEADASLASLHNIFWLYPLIGGSYLLASSWTSNVAEAAYRLRHGHTKGSLSISNLSVPPGTSRKLLQESYRVILIFNYMAIFLVLGKIPFVGRTLSFLFMCLVDGYYCFEQAWIARGWSLERRMRYCEERWAYFIAFGLPSTAVSFFHPSGLLNLMLFTVVFPFCTVLAMLANPQPRISASGSAGSIMSPDVGGATLDYSRSGPLSHLLPGRLAVFWPTIKLHRALVAVAPGAGRALNNTTTSKAFERAFGRQGYSSGFGGGPGRTAAELVGGIWGGTGANGTPQWPSPRLGTKGFQQDGWSGTGVGSGTSSHAMQMDQQIHSRAAATGPVNAGLGQATPPPPPMGKARGRKLD